MCDCMRDVVWVVRVESRRRVSECGGELWFGDLELLELGLRLVHGGSRVKLQPDAKAVTTLVSVLIALISASLVTEELPIFGNFE